MRTIWAYYTTAERRLMLLDRLEYNLSAPRKLYFNNNIETRLVTFSEDPTNGTPKNSAP